MVVVSLKRFLVRSEPTVKLLRRDEDDAGVDESSVSADSPEAFSGCTAPGAVCII